MLFENDLNRCEHFEIGAIMHGKHILWCDVCTDTK